MNNKMAIAAVVVIVVALAAFGTYIIYSDDGADDGIEVPVSQPSVGDFITTKMTEPYGTVWERTYVLTIAEDDMAAEIIVNSYSDKTMWAPYVMDSTDQFYMIVCGSGEGYDLVGTETIDTAFGERACNIYEDANGVRYWICPENGVQYRYVQNGSTCELIGTSLFEGADGLELSQLSDTRSLSEGDYVNMTRYDNNGLTREFYLLVTGVEDGAYQVEYPNGSQSMTEKAFYDRLGAVDQIDGSEFIGNPSPSWTGLSSPRTCTSIRTRASICWYAPMMSATYPSMRMVPPSSATRPSTRSTSRTRPIHRTSPPRSATSSI